MLIVTTTIQYGYQYFKFRKLSTITNRFFVLFDKCAVLKHNRAVLKHNRAVLANSHVVLRNIAQKNTTIPG
jgi:hypothetical protein